MKTVFAIVFTILLGAQAVAQQTSEGQLSGALPDNELLARLKSGGLVLVFRHGETGPNPDREDVVRGDVAYSGSAREKQAAYSACERQRVLSDVGREEMISVADSLMSIGVMVGEVFASPMCRTRETAWLLVGQVVQSSALIGAQNDERTRLVTTKPDGAYNRFLISHGYVVAGFFGDFDRAEGHKYAPRGHAFILDPDGSGEFRVLARLSPVDWARLASLDGNK